MLHGDENNDKEMRANNISLAYAWAAMPVLFSAIVTVVPFVRVSASNYPLRCSTNGKLQNRLEGMMLKLTNLSIRCQSD
jgi:hypothetical protein